MMPYFRNSIKATITLFSVILSMMSCNEVSVNTNSENEKQKEIELRKVVEKVWEDANNSNIQALKDAHLNSPKFSKFGPRMGQRQNVTTTNMSETEHFLLIRETKLVIEDLKIDIFGDIGIATFYNNYNFIKNNNHIKGKGRVTLVFVNADSGWKILHEHSSPYKE